MNKLIEINHLFKKYGKKEVLKDFNLTIESGKIIGLLGPNASGKTTLIKIINGLLKQDAGSVKVDGFDIGEDSKAIISYLPDKTYIENWMKVNDILNYFNDFYVDFDYDKALEILTDFKIDIKENFKTLSKGTKEKVQLALVMSRDAKLYILDEPIAAVDPAARSYILEKIIKYFPKNSTMFIVTHLIRDVESICDEVVFIKDGKVLLHRNSDELREEKNASIDEIFREVFKCY